MDDKQKHLGGTVAFGYNKDITRQFSLGAEVGWSYYGKVALNAPGLEDKDEFSARSIAAVGTWHTTPTIDLFIKGGMAEVNNQSNWYVTNSSNKTANIDVSANRWKPLAAIGAGYAITHHIQINVTYTHIFGDDVQTGNTPVGLYGSNSNQVPRLDSLLLGIKYRF